MPESCSNLLLLMPLAKTTAFRAFASKTLPSFTYLTFFAHPSLSNIIFTAQTHDPGEPRTAVEGADTAGGFNWTIWGGDIYSGWEVVDYAAVAIAESAPLMLTPGRRCENGKPVPVGDPDWVKFTNELAEAGRAAYTASQSRNQEAVSDVSNQVSDACLNCHQVYRDKPGRGLGSLDPSNKASRCVK